MYIGGRRERGTGRVGKGREDGGRYNGGRKREVRGEGKKRRRLRRRKVKESSERKERGYKKESGGVRTEEMWGGRGEACAIGAFEPAGVVMH